MKRRIAAIVSVIAAVLVLIGAAYAFHKKSPVPEAGKTPGLTTLPPVTPSVTVPVSSSGHSSSTAAPLPVLDVAFIGDDYTSGTGASSSSKGFVPLVASQLGVTPHAYSVPGGGYAKPDSNGQTYSSLVSQAVSTHPSIIVVTGGRNDEFDNVDSLTTAVATFFSQLHGAAPTATLVAVTPFYGDSPSPTGIMKLALLVHNGVRGVGGTFIDLTDPLLGHSSYMASSTDPNDSGYAAIATALVSRLQPVVASVQHAIQRSSSAATGSASASASPSG